MKLTREILDLYRRIWATYFGWATTLLPLAVFVFVPLGLIHAIPAHADLNDLSISGAAEVLTLLLAVLVLSAGGLLGEVFYAGAVAIALTHPHDGRPPTLREVAGMINYKRLIAVDLIYVAAAVLGTLAFVLPGIAVYIYFALAAPVVEIEGRTVKEGFKRSVDLVRGHFWLVAAVLLPIELASDALTVVATHLADGVVGNTILDEWFTDAATNVLLTPFYAVAAVLLTLKLISDLDGRAPELHSKPPSP